MITPDQIEFSTSKSKDDFGDTLVKGTIELGCVIRCNRFEVDNAKVNAIELAKAEIRRKILSRVYGELKKPLEELNLLLVQEMPPSHAEFADRLMQRIRTLLNP